MATPTPASAPSTDSFRVLLRSDYPAKEAVVAFNSSATLDDLKTATSSNLGIENKAAARYSYYSVSFRGAIIDFAGKDGKTNLAQSGVKEASTILVRAPPDIAPVKRRPKKEKKDEKEDTKATAASANRYKGLSVNNIFKKLEEKGLAPAKQKIYYEFIDIYASKILKSPTILEMNTEQLLTILKSDTLACNEIEVFDAAMNWAKAECKRQKLDEKENLKKVIQPLMTAIRFPCMNTQDVAIKVSSSGLLEPQQVLELFTYLGLKASSGKASPGSAIAQFNTKERKGRRPPAWFKFDQAKKNPNLVIGADGYTVTSNNQSYYQCAFGDIELTKGVWEWEIVLTQFYYMNYGVNVGVAPSTYTNYTVSNMLAYSGHVPGHAFACGDSKKFNGHDMQAYGRACNQGDVIGVRLDLDKKTIEFFINGVSQGVAFKNVQGPVRPAISIYGNHSVKLQFPSEELGSKKASAKK